MKVVLDINVLVSAFLSAKGAPAQVLEALHQETFELVISEPILDEYQAVLNYEKVQALHQMSSEAITEVIDALKSVAIIVDPAQSLAGIIRDPDDTKFLECAVAGRVLYIVSQDLDLLSLKAYQEIQIVSPGLFLNILKAGR